MEPVKPDHRPQGGPTNRTPQHQQQHDQITVAMANTLAKAAKEFPQLEESVTRTIIKGDELNKRTEEQIRMIEQHEGVIAQKKTVLEEVAEDLKTTQEDYKFKEEELALLMKQNRQMNEALKRELEIENPPKPWNWKRVGLAILSGAAGVATAFILRKRAPVINMAAGACGVANLAKKTSFLKNHSIIAGAGGGLATRWAHDNDNSIGMTTECILAGGAYGELYFDILEKGVEVSGEVAKAFKEGYDKGIKKIVEKETA